MNNYKNLVKYMDSFISDIINKSTIKLCDLLDSEQDIIDGSLVSGEVKRINFFLQDMFSEGFSMSESIIEEKNKYSDYNISSVAASLLCNRINMHLNRLLDYYDNDIACYTIIYERMIFINKLLSGEKDIVKLKKFIA